MLRTVESYAIPETYLVQSYPRCQLNPQNNETGGHLFALFL